ncbi:MAG: hypothetical protein IPK19_01860 [Chloroflexi bacterium]|nr:hypothetical protein [Chloroflexota bacterium]
MELFGVGAWELIAILIIMLLVAGPQRMIAWSYKLGQYVATLRRMWSETAAVLQKELDQAGVDIKVPTQPPTRANIRQEVERALAPVTKPVKESLEAVQQDVNSVKDSTSVGSWSDLKSQTKSIQTPPGKGATPAKPPVPAAKPAAAAQNGKPAPAAAPSVPPASSDSGGSPPDSGADFGSWSTLKDDPAGDS